MKKNWDLSQTQFESLLNWLSEDREKAGEKYEEIRQSLVRLFELKGCSDPQTLADETINRLTSKIHTLKLDNNIKPIKVFFGFAKNVFLEYLRKKETQFDSDSEKFIGKNNYSPDETNFYLDYLQECLKNRPDSERQLILAYYEKNKSEKLEQRRQLAEKLEIAIGTMHTRIHRIKISLQKCIESKLNSKK